MIQTDRKKFASFFNFPSNCGFPISEVWELSGVGVLVDFGAKVLTSYSWKGLLSGYDLLVFTLYYELVGVLDSLFHHHYPFYIAHNGE